MFLKSNNLNVRYFASNILIVLGLVLMWRGTWYVLDGIDKLVFGGSHTYTAILGIFLGVLVLYLPDRDLKEISKL